MRHPYSATIDEIEQCLLRLAETIRAEGRRGDPRPMLLHQAAKIVAEKRECQDQPSS